jgi:hypothetical protein
MTDTIEINDLNVAGFLSLQNIPITLITRQGRVFFLVPGDDRTREELARFQGDPLVPALSLISHIKRLRGKMLDARSGRDGYGNEGGLVNGNRKHF